MTTTVRTVRVSLAGALVALVCLVGAPAAFADTTTSDNWAGYAAHRSGTRFRHVSATWVEPSAACVAGHPTYSAVWVGLGGYRQGSNALEQVGTEVDCTFAGAVSSSAWYEAVPAASNTVSLAVRPGDVVRASVIVTGHRVVLALKNLTTHRAFRKTLHARSIDVSSAEWIVEAPSGCGAHGGCQSLPLADFGSVTIASATAQTVHGARGSVVGPRWGTTEIQLAPGGGRFASTRFGGGSAGAMPSPLGAGGTQFAVRYSPGFTPGRPRFNSRHASPLAPLFPR